MGPEARRPALEIPLEMRLQLRDRGRTTLVGEGDVSQTEVGPARCATLQRLERLAPARRQLPPDLHTWSVQGSIASRAERPAATRRSDALR